MMKAKDIEFPSYWDELTPSEWQHLLKLRGKMERDVRITLKDVKREWVRFVLKGRKYGESLKSVDGLLLIDALANTLDWMWKERADGLIEMTFEVTDQLLPTWRRLRGPQSHGADLTFGEFRQAMAFCNGYTKDHRPEQLTALCGVLYRASGDSTKGEYRERFNPNLLPFYASRVHQMPDYLKWGVYAWFSSFCKFLTDGIFIIDGYEVSFAPIFSRSKGEGEADQSLGLNSILYSVAESGVFGNVHETDDSLLLRVLMKLLDDHNKAEALRKELKK